MKQKVYITEYALTKGIITEMATIKKSNYGANMAIFDNSKKVYRNVFFIGINAFLNEEDAIKNAEEKRKTKISQLKLEITKLEEKRFKI